MAGRSRGRVTLCAVCIVHKEMRSAGFLVQPQNQGRRFPVWPQNRWRRFGDLGVKITATVSWFGPQNQVGYSLSVASQNRREDEDGAGHASKSSGLLRAEASRARVSQSGLKTGRGAARVVHVAPSRRSRGSEAERWSVRWRRGRRSGSRTKLPFIRSYFLFSPQGHFSLSVFTINRTIGLV